MKSFLQNLLIFFSLGLCAVLIYQWVTETELRRRVQKLTDEIQDKREVIQGLEGTKRRNESEIQRLDALKTDLNNTIQTNQAQILSLTKNLDESRRLIERHEKQLEDHKQVIDTAKATIENQNNRILTQNEEMKKLAEERNDFVRQLNKLAGEYKELAERWNKQQEDLAKASTNAPASK